MRHLDGLGRRAMRGGPWARRHGRRGRIVLSDRDAVRRVAGSSGCEGGTQLTMSKVATACWSRGVACVPPTMTVLFSTKPVHEHGVVEAVGSSVAKATPSWNAGRASGTRRKRSRRTCGIELSSIAPSSTRKFSSKPRTMAVCSGAAAAYAGTVVLRRLGIFGEKNERIVRQGEVRKSISTSENKTKTCG